MKTRKTTSFYIEALIITFFLLAFSTVLLQMFSASKQISDKARLGADAVLIAQNASARFTVMLDRGTNKSEEKVIKTNYAADGLPSEKGEYCAVLSSDFEETSAGKIYNIMVEVYAASSDDKALFTLETKHFTNK